MRLCFSSTRRA